MIAGEQADVVVVDQGVLGHAVDPGKFADAEFFVLFAHADTYFAVDTPIIEPHPFPVKDWPGRIRKINKKHGTDINKLPNFDKPIDLRVTR